MKPAGCSRHGNAVNIVLHGNPTEGIDRRVGTGERAGLVNQPRSGQRRNVLRRSKPRGAPPPIGCTITAPTMSSVRSEIVTTQLPSGETFNELPSDVRTIGSTSSAPVAR